MALCHGFLTWYYRLQSFVECRTSYRDKIAETFNSNTHWIINPIKTLILSFELAPNLTSKENKQKYPRSSNLPINTVPIKCFRTMEHHTEIRMSSEEVNMGTQSSQN